MRYHSGRISGACVAAALLMPLLAACSNPPQAAQPTSAPLATSAPTAAPQPTTAAQATSAPQATSVPQPTTQTQSAPSSGGPLRSENLEFGVVNHLYYTNRDRVLTLTGIAGFEWVRQQIQWKDMEGPEPKDYKWGELDQIIEDTNARKLKLLISIVRAPSFYNETNGLPANPSDMGDFVEALVTRYGTKIQAIEIWNEQNLAHENGGRVTVEDAGKYVEILAESYKRIKALQPSIIVVAGGPSSSAVNDPSLAVSDEAYFKAMYTYKDGMIKDYFDVQAVHPGGAANPPDTLYPEKPSRIEGCQPAPDRCWNDDETHYFRHVENVRRFMVENGVGDHQIWITEFGWATPNNTPGYEFGNYVSLNQQSDYILGAVNRAYENYRDDQGRPWLGAMFLWNMNFAVLWGEQGNPNHEQAAFGLLNPDWSPRPAFVGLQGRLAEIKAEQKR